MTEHKDDDNPLTGIGVGKINISTFPIPMPLFFVDFGDEESSLFEQFQHFEKLKLVVKEISPFEFQYAVYSDILLFTITKEILGRVDRGEKIEAILKEHPHEYAFMVSFTAQRHWHTVFTKALNASSGSWVLMIRGTTTSIFVVDQSGKIVERIEQQRIYFPEIDD